jgi:hypothetical protein
MSGNENDRQPCNIGVYDVIIRDNWLWERKANVGKQAQKTQETNTP